MIMHLTKPLDWFEGSLHPYDRISTGKKSVRSVIKTFFPRITEKL